MITGRTGRSITTATRLLPILAGLLTIVGLVAGRSNVRGDDTGELDKEKAAKVFPAKPMYSPYAGRNFPRGRSSATRTCTPAFSMDAGAFGARLGPRDAYRFARGEEIMASSGQPVKLSRPLDFLVVADHSDNMGLFPDLFAGKPELLADPTGRKWYDMIQAGKGARGGARDHRRVLAGHVPEGLDVLPRHARPTAARGRRPSPPRSNTTIPAASPPSSATSGPRTPAATTCIATSSSATTATRPARSSRSPCTRRTAATIRVDLWKWMDAYEKKTGGSVLAIAHNGNLSNGLMFPIVEAFGKPIDREYAETRAKWERLYEATQTKGDGEAHPFLSPNDEFADFERWDKGNLDGSVAKTKEMLEFEYARSALKNGLKLEQQLGVNPYKFGLVGSTRCAHRPCRHGGGQLLRQDHAAGAEPRAHARHVHRQSQDRREIMDWEVGSVRLRRRVGDGEHARGDLGRHAAQGDLRHHRPAHGRALLRRLGVRARPTPTPAALRVVGYTKGVPMGGDLRQAPAGKAPTFLVAALKDPIGANLDRIQIVKGWLDAKGELQEKVYDVAWGGDRKPGADGKLPSVGNTVDVANATWTNTIGAPELIAVWKDPDFDADAARVLLRPRHRDPHAALDRLRRQALRREAAAGHADDHHRARLHVADLVHAVSDVVHCTSRDGSMREHQGPFVANGRALFTPQHRFMNPWPKRSAAGGVSRWSTSSPSARCCSLCSTGGRRGRRRTASSSRPARSTHSSPASHAPGSARRPTTELKALVDDYVREEIATREAMAHGPRPRRHGHPAAAAPEARVPGRGQRRRAPPTDAELQAWLDAHPEHVPRRSPGGVPPGLS